jgi:penicillin-binding protein 2
VSRGGIGELLADDGDVHHRSVRPALGWRFATLATVAVAMFVALFVRLYFLQVLSTDQFQAAADESRVETVVVPPARGRILDRNGVVLADNRFESVILVDGAAFTDPERELEAVFRQLNDLLGLPIEDMRARYVDERQDPFLPKVVADGLTDAQRVLVEERRLPGVTGERRAVRNYPHGTLGAHILGYVGQISEEQYELAPDEYTMNAVVGRAGIEQVLEEDLRGVAGSRTLELNRTREVVGEVGQAVPPVSGHDVYLTIDARVQAEAQDALTDGLQAAREGKRSEDSGLHFPAPAGAAVVLDIESGEVLAMASFPDFDPNALVGRLSEADYQRLFADTARPAPLNNRAIQGQYAVGSTFKLVTSLAALDTGAIAPRQLFNDTGVWMLPGESAESGTCDVGCRFRNTDSTALGAVDMSVALTRSSDVYFYDLGYRIGIGQVSNPWAIQDMARELGFGSVTGIQLPYEAAGRVPDAATKEELFWDEVIDDGYWYTGDNINLSVGQGMLSATPLQLANAYGTWANGGTHFSPNLVDEIRTRPAGELVRSFESRVMNEVELPPGNEVIVEGLSRVTSMDHLGTAAVAFEDFDDEGFGVIAKTGTAQSTGRSQVTGRRLEDTAVFVAAAPAEQPRYAVAVLMEESGFGGDAAAPVARRILEYLRDLERSEGVPAQAIPYEPVECTAEAIVQRYGAGTALSELGMDTLARLVGCDPAEVGTLPAPVVDELQPEVLDEALPDTDEVPGALTLDDLEGVTDEATGDDGTSDPGTSDGAATPGNGTDPDAGAEPPPSGARDGPLDVDEEQ